MPLLLLLALRNSWRNGRRTALTALTVMFGTGIFTIALSWIEGVTGSTIGTASNFAGHVRIVQEAYVAREDLLPLSENIADVAPLVEKIRALPGVVGVYPRIVSGATVSVGEEIGEVFGPVFGADPAWFDERLGVKKALTAGQWFTGDASEVILGARLAQKVGLKPGDEVILLGLTQDGSLSPLAGKVVGIASAGSALVDQGVFVPLAKAQYFADMDGGATEILVYTDDLYGAGSLEAAVAEVVNAGGPTTLKVQAWLHRPPYDGVLAIITFVKSVLVGAIVLVTSLGVWNTMMMSVLERTGEIGVLRAMGMGRAGVVVVFVVEALVIAAMGGLLGVAVGGTIGMGLEIWGVELGTTVTQNLGASYGITGHLYGDMSARVGLLAFGLGLVIAVVGTAPPALRAVAIQPVEAMRSRR